MHEASLHDRNSFLTLTYAEDPISLRVDDLQRFFKRLRNRGSKVRYYACGEYGEDLGRPHFHVCLFGEDFSLDRQPYKKGLWVSPCLEELWTHGHCVIGDLSFETAAYVAQYVMKKMTGEAEHWHYWRCHEDTGELLQVEPEFPVMSRRPGIGRDWFESFRREVTRDDSVVVRGRECKPPRYYDKLLEAVDPASFEDIKDRRKVVARRFASENTDERLVVREAVAKARGSSKRRTYET